VKQNLQSLSRTVNQVNRLIGYFEPWQQTFSASNYPGAANNGSLAIPESVGLLA
jgi:hypothetical protein